MKTVTVSQSGRQLIVNRLMNAPRELVFEAWTNPDHLAQWFGPDGFTLTTHSMEMKVNGIWKYTMHGPDGRNYKNKIKWLEIVKPEKLVYKHEDDDPSVEPVGFVTTVEFKELGNKTELSMVMIFESIEELQRVEREYGAIAGAEQTIGRLEKLLIKLT